MESVDRRLAEQRLTAEAARAGHVDVLSGHRPCVVYQSRADMVSVLHVDQGGQYASVIAYVRQLGDQYALYSGVCELWVPNWATLDVKAAAVYAQLLKEVNGGHR